MIHTTVNASKVELRTCDSTDAANTAFAITPPAAPHYIG